MVDPMPDVSISTVESNLYNMAQALLKEMNSQSASQKGMLRWSLQRKLESDPSCSVSLIQVLIKELEKKLKRVVKIHKTQSLVRVIAMLHTLCYVVIQSGSLYQRRVVAEQSLKNEHFTLKEKVFVLADPAVFSAPLEATVRAQLEASNLLRNTPTMERNVVLHVLQAGLGTTCQSSRLTLALGALGDHMVEKYFQEVVLAVEESIKHGTGGRANYLNKLQHVYRDVLTASEEDITRGDHDAPVCTALPCPDINFLLWREEEDLWKLLSNFALRCCPNSIVDEEEKYKADSVWSKGSEVETDLKESNCDEAEQPPVGNPVTAFSRRNAFKKMKPADKLRLMREKIEAFPGSSPVLKEESRLHTARVVVMGDDRVLGRLSRAYRSIRERESKLLILTKKLNLQFYYIPVTDEVLSSPDSRSLGEDRLYLASLLGRVDPWYNNNINSLRAAVSKPVGMQSNLSEPSEDTLFLLDTLCYYLRCGTQPVNLPLYSVKMTRSSCDVCSVVEEVFVSHLEADIPQFRHLKDNFSKEPPARRKKATVEGFGAVISVSYTKSSLSKREVVKGDALMTCGVAITSETAAVTSGKDFLTVRFDSMNPGYNTEIQTQNISIRTVEDRTLSVCLDKDPRRTYTDVQRLDISPCLDPGCSVRSSKYLDRVLSLPVNTFTGVTP
ncbi:phosphoinositide 3-kinase regulatory subunit 6 [Pempheris klunzingeri]|uniref:phosphoinositide 3-kinase regulatory subunit 6 n=1 Tax=Pempheris klunzingeri TaxID=3127111 RepID=UPI00397FFF9A